MLAGPPRGDESLAADAAALFRAEHGQAPAGVWAAPGRVNLIGEHVDYAAGVCLPTALPHCTAIAAAPRGDGRLSAVSLAPGGRRLAESCALDEVGAGRPAGWLGYVAGTLAALGAGGCDLAIVSDVPAGAGLSSSAALTCATALAAAGLAGNDDPDEEERRRLLAAAVRAENHVVGANTGGLDQAASLLAEAGHAVALDFADDTARLVPFDPGAAGLSVLVADTRVAHDHAAGGYGSRRGLIDDVARRLAAEGLGFRDPGALEAAVRLAGPELGEGLVEARVRHVVEETARASRATQLAAAGRLVELGELMTESHRSLRDLFEVSTGELDSAVDAALGAGAAGARLTGGGFGGSAIALCPDPEAIAAAIAEAAKWRGYPEPRFFLAPPAAGARRIA